jgi:hypothetical protein
MRTCTKCGLEKTDAEFYVYCLTHCKACKIEASKTRINSMKEEFKEYTKDYQRNNKDKLKAANDKYRKKNADKYREWHRRKSKTESYRARKRQYMRNRRLTNRQYMLACRVRARQQKFRKLKPDHTDAVLGCTWAEFTTYIESKFQPGMSWDNQHLWHLDHIKPLSWFNLEDPQQYKESAHYTNYQPLWAEDNMKKGNRYAG